MDPKTIFEPVPNPKNSPLYIPKVKKDPKIKSKSNVRIERNQENESCSTILYYTIYFLNCTIVQLQHRLANLVQIGPSVDGKTNQIFLTVIHVSS